MFSYVAIRFVRILFPRIIASHKFVQNKFLNNSIISECKRCTFYNNSFLNAGRLKTVDSDDILLPNDGLPVDEIKAYSTLLTALEAKMRFTEKEVSIIAKEMKGRRGATRDFNKVIDLLLKYLITKQTILENQFILANTARNLEAKFRIMETMRPRDMNDLVPLLRISAQRLSKIAQISRREAKIIPGGNRIYYISDKLNIEPKVVSKFLSKRIFMLEMQHETLTHNLENMVEFNVEPLNILRDLWAFRYTPKSVKARLERAKNAKKNKIMPWMVRCPERILQKSLKLSLDEKKLLGEKNTVVDYLSMRLGFDAETTKAIMSKHPAVFKVRVTKIKEFLDYLLGEGGFTNFDIAQVPRIFCHSLETTKHRMQELKSYGCHPSSLIILCRSQREYQSFLSNWIKSRSKFANKSKVE